MSVIYPALIFQYVQNRFPESGALLEGDGEADSVCKISVSYVQAHAASWEHKGLTSYSYKKRELGCII